MTASQSQLRDYKELDRTRPPLEDADNRTLSYSEGQIQGLGNIPVEWPELPANRLSVVEVRPSGAIRVHRDHFRPVLPKTSIGRRYRNSDQTPRHCRVPQ